MNSVVAVKTNALIGSEEVKVLRDSLFRGFTDAEVNYSVAICNQLSLSPLLRQIHFVKRKVKDGENWKDIIVAQTGIDGFRLAAQRAGGYAGSDDAVLEYGQDQNQPSKATVTVYKMVDGQRCAFTASARWIEYFPGDKQSAMWRKMPAAMLAKCAEALALRKAFPAELSALRSDEEMQQADGPSKAEQVQARVMPKVVPNNAIETTATHVDEPSHEPGDAAEPPEVQDHFCVLCNAKLIKSERKPLLYCPHWRDKSKGDHGVVSI